MHMELRGHYQGLFIGWLPTFAFERQSLIGLELTKQAVLTGCEPEESTFLLPKFEITNVCPVPHFSFSYEFLHSSCMPMK